jgi:LCP family protein required for cell wall assembly
LSKHLSPTDPQSTGRAPHLLRRAALVVGLVLVLAGSALAGFAIFKHESPIQLIADVFVPPPDQVFGKPNLLILVEGLDYDYNQLDVEFSKQSRSDVIKVLNIDFVNKGAYVLSVPRDMHATFPNGSQGKINGAQSEGGVQEAKQVIGGFLGLPSFDRYVLLRIDATKDLINAIGGIDIYVKTSDCLRNNTGCTGGRIDYDDSWGHLHTHLKEGLQHLDGPQAVGYGRFRHDWCSDPCRIMRQDQVINAALDKLKGDKLNTMMRAGSIMAVLRKDVETDLKDNEITSLGAYLSGFSTKDLHFAQVPYTDDVGGDLLPDKPALAQLVQNMLIAPPSPQPSPDAMALAAIAPASIRVDVKNASGVNGIGKLVAAQLRKAGFVIGDVGNADESGVEKTKLVEHSNVTFAGAKVRAALPALVASAAISGAPMTASPDPTSTSTPSDVTLVIGSDLAAAIVAKGAAPSAPPNR